MGSLKRAPSLAAEGGSGLAGAGGMAASTAMKMLRADSKRVDGLLDLDKILGVVLDTVWRSRSRSRSWQEAARINVSENQDLHLALRWF